MPYCNRKFLVYLFIS